MLAPRLATLCEWRASRRCDVQHQAPQADARYLCTGRHRHQQHVADVLERNRPLRCPAVTRSNTPVLRAAHTGQLPEDDVQMDGGSVHCVLLFYPGNNRRLANCNGRIRQPNRRRDVAFASAVSRGRPY